MRAIAPAFSSVIVKSGSAGMHPFDVEAHGRDVLDAASRVGAEVGHRQWLHRVDALAHEPERCPARGEDIELAGGVEKARDIGGRFENLLEVVQHEQCRLAAERRHDGLDRITTGGLARAENVRRRGNDEGRVRDGREIDEDRTDVPGHAACRGERKPRLARPARAGERHESDLGTREKACDGRDLPLASHERRRVGRERTGLRLRRRRRRGELELGVLAEDALLERAELR